MLIIRIIELLNKYSSHSIGYNNVLTIPVVVHGGWGIWIMTSCSKTCGGGVKHKHRDCNSPKPSGGGLKCMMGNGSRSLEEDLTVSCNTARCTGTLFIGSLLKSKTNLKSLVYPYKK